MKKLDKRAQARKDLQAVAGAYLDTMSDTAVERLGVIVRVLKKMAEKAKAQASKPAPIFAAMKPLSKEAFKHRILIGNHWVAIGALDAQLDLAKRRGNSLDGAALFDDKRILINRRRAHLARIKELKAKG